MNKILLSNSIFANITESEFTQLLTVLEHHFVKLSKNAILLHSDSPLKDIGILLVGKLLVVSESEEGQNSIVNEILPGESFGEALVSTNTRQSPFTIQCLEDCEIFFFDFTKFLSNPNNPYYQQMITNMMNCLASKVMNLNFRFVIASKRKIRNRLLAYLNTQKRIHQSSDFVINLNREQLADYLFADRSALSYVLMQLKKEGVIKYQKNHFTLL